VLAAERHRSWAAFYQGALREWTG